MQRRMFLGTVLGFIAGTKIPFKVEEPKAYQPQNSRLEKYRQFVRVFDVDESILKSYRVVLVTTEGLKFSGSKIKTVTRDFDKLICQFIGEEIDITQTVTLRGVIIINELNVQVSEFNYSQNACCMRGDTLKNTVSISLPG